MKNILVPVGSSKNIVSHLQYAVDFAKAVNAKLYVVQIYNVYTKAGTMINVDQILERESIEYLKDLLTKIDPKGVDIIVNTVKGKLIDTLELIRDTADIDLILVEPRMNSTNEEVFIGNTSGKIIKQMVVVSLIDSIGIGLSRFLNLVVYLA